MIKLNFNYNDMNVDSEELLVKDYTEWQRDLFNDLSGGNCKTPVFAIATA